MHMLCWICAYVVEIILWAGQSAQPRIRENHILFFSALWTLRKDLQEKLESKETGYQRLCSLSLHFLIAENTWKMADAA